MPNEHHQPLTAQVTARVSGSRADRAANRPVSAPWWRGCVRSIAAVLGALATCAALGTVWALRLASGENVYVSQLGADGEPTSLVFNRALMLLAAGGLLVAWGSHPRSRRSRWVVVSAWSTSTTLAVAGTAFTVASRVTCTSGCPVPLTPGSSPQDLVHVSAAVLGFGAAVWAMVQVAASPAPRAVSAASAASAVSVAVIASAGGLLSIAGAGTSVGALLEFTAMTVAAGWLAAYALWTATPENRGSRWRSRWCVAPRYSHPGSASGRPRDTTPPVGS